ncbi:hypothetical protein HUA76_37650 [Myxococcus sp. CA056]|uniref:hypothetical protein n=1 Tax=Myxococcus sp. CA056 TaxID=2741740 RepID=UPI00157B5D15|nr:hypothetical protein [Myxococcus sp. CA056]NTX16513.1 hypothetical protein [Myxococcus sp. CA056]
MTSLGLLFLVLAAAPARDAAEVPPNVAVLLQRHCSGCHDEDSSLDLRQVPGPSDLETWRDIHKAVETGRMPPSAKDAEGLWKGPGNSPVPLGPGYRQELASSIAALLEAQQHPAPPRTAMQLSLDDWLLIVREVAHPYMSAGALEALVAPRLELEPSARHPLIAMDVCTRVIDTDLGRPAGKRTLVDVAEGPASEKATEAITQRLFRLVYQQEPSAADTKDGQARFRRFQRIAPATRDAAAALCTSYLAGIRVLRLELAPAPTTAR